MNLFVVCGLCIALNLQRVKAFSLGYFMPVWLWLFTGLFLGTNSLQSMDLKSTLFLPGTAMGLTMGGAEMFGYVLVVAATVKVGVFRRTTWWRYREHLVRVGRLRDVRLEPAEWLALAAGVGAIVLAAWRES